jgi:hypothetical protein
MASRNYVRLSDNMATSLRYFIPVCVSLALLNNYLTIKENQFTHFLIIIFAIVYWFFEFLPLKHVLLKDNYLTVSNGFKKEKIALADIESLKTGGWPMYHTRIH